MIVETLSLTNFRLYQTQTITFHPNINILYGRNAQGKTTVIEALYVIGLTKSHKTNKDSDLIRNTDEYAKINALINLKEKDIQLDIILSKEGKKAKYNQIELTKLSDYIGQLNVVMFAPEDLELIKRNPQTRRKFLDLEIGQISKEYLYNLQNYKKILKQRNELLKTLQNKNEKDLMVLDIITDQLIEYLELITLKRKQFISEISDFSKKIYQTLANTNQKLQIKYIPSLNADYKTEFVNKYQYDIITGTTNLGVHRDDVEFCLDDLVIKTHGSQGEQRTAVLAIKLALVEFINKYKEEYPVLLLDDVLSELDKSRQNSLLEYIKNKTQTIITTTDLRNIELEKMKDYTLFKVDKGTIEESDINGKQSLWFK